jgi:hypothetical protein
MAQRGEPIPWVVAAEVPRGPQAVELVAAMPPDEADRVAAAVSAGSVTVARATRRALEERVASVPAGRRSYAVAAPQDWG